MPLKTPFQTTTISANGRTVLTDPSPRQYIELAILNGATFGSGTVSIDVSYEVTPVVGTEAHWSPVSGLSSISAAGVYQIETRGSTIAINLTGATAPSIVVVWG